MKSLIADFEATTPPLDYVFNESDETKAQIKNFETEVWASCFSDLDKDDHFVLGYSINEFMLQIFRYPNANVYFHNLGGYDGQFILDWLHNHGYVFVAKTDYSGNNEKFYCGDREGFTVYNKSRTYNFIDTTSLLTGSIGYFGESLSIMTGEDFAKGETPLIPHGMKLTDIKKDDGTYWTFEEANEYIKRDVYILKETMKRNNIASYFENNINTQASLAYRTLMNYGEKIEAERIEEFKPKHKCKQLKIPTNMKLKQWINTPKGPHPVLVPMTPQEREIAKLERKEKANKKRQETLKAKRNGIIPNKPKSLLDANRKQSTRINFKTKAKAGTMAQIHELENIVNDENESDERRDLAKRKLIEVVTKAARVRTNKNVLLTYKGGISFTNPLYQNKWVGKGTGIDINSMYPWIYSTKALPSTIKKIINGDKVIGGITKHIVDRYENEFGELYTVNFTKLKAVIKPNRMPILKPRTDDENNKLSSNDERLESINRVAYYLPVLDLDNYSITSMEYKYLYENYDIEIADIESLNFFERDYELEAKCKAHVDKWIKLKEHAKQTDDKFLEWYSKMMLNSAYGKFGNFDKEYPVYDIIADDNGVPKQVKISDQRGGNDLAEVSAASFITAYGRVYLGETINKIGMDKFLYCDTDSAYFLGWYTEEELANLGIHIHATELGAWSIDAKFIDGKFIKAKTYGVTKFIKAKKDDDLTGKELTELDGTLGYWEWKTTASGKNGTIPRPQFDIGSWVLDKRSTIVKGGTILVDTKLTIGRIEESYKKLWDKHIELWDIAC